MSEAQQEETNTNTQAISIDEIRQEALAAARAEVGEILKTQKTVSEEQVNKIVAERLGSVAKAISGQDEPQDSVNPLLRKLVTDPDGVLATVAELSAQHTLEQIRRENAQEREFNSAYTELFQERPDLASSKANLKLVDTFYKNADPQKPIRDRVKEAVREFDLLMEEQGLGDSKSRIAKASTVTSASAGSSQPQATKQSETELLKQEQDERQARFRKSRNL